MSSIPTPSDLAPDLTLIAWHQLAHTLRKTLPPPLTDTPEGLLHRDQAAIARVAALCPVTVAEADIAALHVATSEQWKHCLCLAQAPDTTPEQARQCRAQANAMMRQTQSALRLLLRMQAAREKRDADTRTCEQAACAEHRTLSLMTEALAQGPAAAPEPVGAPPEPAPPPDPPPPPPPDLPEPEPIDPPLTDAEQYVVLYPERAALIRRCKGVPETVSFGPPDPELVRELLAATGPFFEALDVVYADAKAVSPPDPSSHTTRNETPIRLAAA